MSDVSIITSLYKSNKFLPQYIERAKMLAREIKSAGIDLEFIIVPNDASEGERQMLSEFGKALESEQTARVHLHYVLRETLYASWNRAVSFASSDIFAFWNVDDIRTAEGIIEGHRLLNTTSDLVDFAFNIQQSGKTTTVPATYRTQSIAPKTGVSPFFMIHRRLIDTAGNFNPHFRITGDYEWSKRKVVQDSNIARSKVISGTFILHDDNLSGGTPTEWVEFNLALLIHKTPQLMRPVDPELMRQYWEEWGYQYITLSDEISNLLWGEGAKKRFERYRWERSLPPIIRKILLSLARRGLAYSADWEWHDGMDALPS